MSRKKAVLVALAAVVVAGAVIWALKGAGFPGHGKTLSGMASSREAEGRAELGAFLDRYRKVIVLLADEREQPDADRRASDTVARMLFHENLDLAEKLQGRVAAALAAKDLGVTERYAVLDGWLNYIESDGELYDADRLAFREFLSAMQSGVATDSSLTAVKFHKRLTEDLEALDEIQRNYDKEVSAIFSRFETRAIPLKRERWDDYVSHLRRKYSRERILKDYGVIVPYPEPESPSGGAQSPESPAGGTPPQKAPERFSGRELPAGTVALTFDDGPHAKYTAEITAILKQYEVPAVFFQVGRNLGAVDADGKVTLRKSAEISRQLEKAGFVLGNHSYSHAQLSKATDDALKSEILDTDALLRAIDSRRAPLFRFPYGAYNAQAMRTISDAHLKSVLWNIDSLDWADPVPRSIADRVMRTLEKEKRGIILFHDIHERTISALPLVLDRLVAEGYRFAAWDGATFKADEAAAPTLNRAGIGGDVGDGWALLVGIDGYAKWPKLQYATRDAEAVRRFLVEEAGFAPERIVSLKDEEATRDGILTAFHKRFVEGGVKPDDRIFVFFAGHGATRQLSSGRKLGYIVPVDSNPADFSVDAIPMTELQNIAESLPAKHVLFVMDACYSGLGLTRGVSSATFLRENAKRVGRQMLTAGGSDQLVADGGPGGHSIFTWALLQGLSGKADLNNDSFITATELAAYIVPAVSSVSPQTPAFGSLPGSEGGEFVFALAGGTEFLSGQSEQLSSAEIALNGRLDAPLAEAAAASGAPGGESAPLAPITITDLQGEARQIVVPPPVKLSPRQLAQRANDRGLQLYREKQYAAAAAEFAEALKLRPDFALAANNLGFVYYRQDKFAEAARWFENAIKMDPSRAVAYLNAGDAYDRMGEKAKAVGAYKMYLELAPTGPAAAHVKRQLDK
ncbi:MAG: polysaccharide deacetylase family protein [Acidobacteriota bacterium]|jgi:peptidoglycan/xylan/chitin deacetylase (PgdA/CDA1 family)/uncharacterized caspase-like protein|nr:polysaccharide deacetylase family protein [Acidobacteriota bacterium]